MPNIIGYTIKNQWLNFSLYFPNFMYKTKRNLSNSKVCPWIISDKTRLKANSQPIGGKQTNTQFLGDGSTYQTDFIEINKEDLVNVFYNQTIVNPLDNNSYLQLGLRLDINGLKGTYKRDTTSLNTNQENNNNDPSQYYFVKGIFNNDIIQYLINSKVI